MVARGETSGSRVLLNTRTEGARRVLCAPPARRLLSHQIQTFHVWLPSARRSAADFSRLVQSPTGVALFADFLRVSR
jgi:hypothetical protein